MNIRRADPQTDYERIAELFSIGYEMNFAVSRLHEWDQVAVEQNYRYMGETDSGIIAYGSVHHTPWEADERFHINLVVDPVCRKQGHGTAFYEFLYDKAVSHGARIIDVEVHDASAEGLRFAEKRGFVIDHHMFESVIDLKTFDENQFADLVAEVEAQGIRFTSLAAEGDTQEARRKLHYINSTCHNDDPSSHGSFPDFEELNTIFDTSSWFIPEGQILATEGDDFIGMSAIGYNKDGNLMYNNFTGVLPAYRGRKIAQALKVKSISFAKAFGADTIRTHNDSHNSAMLAVNRKLGYKPQAGEYRMVKHV